MLSAQSCAGTRRVGDIRAKPLIFCKGMLWSRFPPPIKCPPDWITCLDVGESAVRKYGGGWGGGVTDIDMVPLQPCVQAGTSEHICSSSLSLPEARHQQGPFSMPAPPLSPSPGPITSFGLQPLFSASSHPIHRHSLQDVPLKQLRVSPFYFRTWRALCKV